MLAVARAAGMAAHGIAKVQSDLATLRGDAAERDMTVDPLTNTVIPGGDDLKFVSV